MQILTSHQKLPGPPIHSCNFTFPVEYQAFYVLKMIENALISSALQRSSFGPDVQAIAQTQALVRDDPHFLFTVMTKVHLVLFSMK